MIEARDIRNLSEAYLAVYSSSEELDEATAAAKRGIAEPHRNQKFLDMERKNSARLMKTPAGKKLLKTKSEYKRQKPKPIPMSGTKSPEVARREYSDRVEADNKRVIKRGLTKKQAALTAAINKLETREEVDIYDIVLLHLLDEGYADTFESAEVIMVNMSEDWREDILDEARKKVKIHTDKPIEYKIADIGPGKKEYNVKTSKGWKEEYELNEGPYDAEVMGRSQIRKTGEGGRIGAERKKSTPERRRMRAVGGGKMEPVEYKPRKDIGTQRQTSTRVQEPTQERGSADVRSKAAAAAKEERKKAALARIAAKKGGAASSTKEKPKEKEIEKQASKLLTTKKETKPVSPDYKPSKASGYTAKERMSITRKGETKLKGIMKQQEVDKYKEATGQNPTGKALTKVLARVHQRMST